GPGPAIVASPTTAGRADNSEMVPVRPVASTVSAPGLALALRMASRRLAAPLSAVVVTADVAGTVRSSRRFGGPTRVWRGRAGGVDRRALAPRGTAASDAAHVRDCAAVAGARRPPRRLRDGIGHEPDRPVHEQGVHPPGVVTPGRDGRVIDGPRVLPVNVV